MALDVYVGPLTRFYAGNWKTIIAQAADGRDPDCGSIGRIVKRVSDFQSVASDGQGQTFEVKVAQGRLEPRGERDNQIAYSTLHVQERIEEWRKEVNEALAARLDQPISWVEDPSGPYFTDKPGWDSYQALVLWAAHEEDPELRLPAVAPQDPYALLALEASTDERDPGRYPTLRRSDYWLPGAHSFTFETQSPVGAEITLGFTGSLLNELRTLNARTWKASDRRVARWLRKATRRGDALKRCAKFAFAVFYLLAEKAEEQGLPMVLDW